MPEPIRIALVDDDTEYATAQKRIAVDHGFDLTWFKTWEAAKDAVEERRFKLVILDAKGQLDDDSPTEDIAHLHQARNDLAEWRGRNIHIPYVICTGFDEGATAKLREEKRYLKGNEREMYADIKRMVDRSGENALRQRYADVMVVLKQPFFDVAAEGLLIETLLFVERGDRSGRDRFFMNPLRQVLEHWFHAAHRCGFLPDELVKPDLNQRHCARYLSGEKVDFPSRATARTRLWTEMPVLPKLLSTALNNVLNVTNWGSHAMLQEATLEDTNYLADNEEAFREHGGSPYLLSTVVFQLMDILIFFNRFVADHPDPKANKSWNQREDLMASTSDPEGRREVKNARVVLHPGQKFAHAADCFINGKLIEQHALQHGDLVDMQVEPSTKKHGTFQAITITKH